jgi:rRNA maturation RNase YbeY
MEPPSRGFITVLNSLGWEIESEPIVEAVSGCLVRHALERADVTVLLTDDDEIARLNAQFRGVEGPTDVLTFPLDADGSGDIAISLPYAQRQANLRGVGLAQEVAYLAIHGALHLAGFEDESDEDRAAMMREMNLCAVAVGLPSDEAWSSLLHAEEVA